MTRITLPEVDDGAATSWSGESPWTTWIFLTELRLRWGRAERVQRHVYGRPNCSTTG